MAQALVLNESVFRGRNLKVGLALRHNPRAATILHETNIYNCFLRIGYPQAHQRPWYDPRSWTRWIPWRPWTRWSPWQLPGWISWSGSWLCSVLSAVAQQCRFLEQVQFSMPSTRRNSWGLGGRKEDMGHPHNPLPNVTRHLASEFLFFSYLSKRNVNWLVLPATGYSNIWVVYAWLWSCGSNEMYNNRPGTSSAAPLMLRGRVWGKLCNHGNLFLVFFFSILFLH